MWIVTYYNINNWGHDWSEFEDEEEAMEFAKERLEIQKVYEYLDGKVKVFPPSVDIEIV